MEGNGEDVALAHGDRMAVHLRKHLDPVTDSSTQGARMKTAWSGSPSKSSSVSNDASWRPKALRRTSMSSTPRCVAVQHDHSRRRCRARACPLRDELHERLGEALALDAEPDGRGLAARDDQAVEAVEIVGWGSDLARP